VTEDQVRQEMVAEGYSNPQVMREGRYFEATGIKDGQMQKLVVDSQTGRLRTGGGRVRTTTEAPSITRPRADRRSRTEVFVTPRKEAAPL
jgi:hypothetical protein